MAEAIKSGNEREINPIDLLEETAHDQDWGYDRECEDELTMVVRGIWSDYNISLNWRDDKETLHVACAFELKVPNTRLNEIFRLIAIINEQLWIGHFDYWQHEGLMMFRHGLLLNDTVATRAQCDALLKAALEAGERYYQAFQFVVWAGKNSRDALATAIFETEGCA
ncbi:MAG: hypothetical protein TECD_00118 [Hyphomicrobiaceae bacterium hypho_1]